MLYRFLERCKADVPSDTHDWIPWKHQRVPPSDNDVPHGFRSLYLFDNPMNAVLSVFRREYQHWHIDRINGDVEAWDESWSLEDYLEHGDDLFRLSDHFNQWSTADRSYPILLLRFDALWDRLPEVFAFLGLATSLMGDFPGRKERSSDWTTESDSIQQGLREMYGDLHREIADAPDLKII